MDWMKIVAGFVIMIGVIVIWFRVMKQIRGDRGSGVDVSMPKRRKRRADEGWTNAWKKAIVTLKDGDRIILT